MRNYTTIKINLKRNIKDKNKYRCKTKSSSGHSILFSHMPIEKKKTLNNDMQFSESKHSFSGSCTIQILVTLQLKLNKCHCIQRKNVNLTIS